MRSVAALIVLLAVTLSGCADTPDHYSASSSPSTSTNPDRAYTFPQKMGPMTTTWEASPGLDLTDPLPTVARAYFESLFIASTYTKEIAFPGFVRLFGDNQYQLIDGEAKTYAGWTGTRRMKLQSITEKDGVVRATVCDDRAGLYRQKFVGKPQEVVMPEDRFRYGIGHRPYMDEPYTWFVELHQAKGEPRWPSDPAIGEARAPNWDVFEGWELIDTGFAESWQTGTPCDQWARKLSRFHRSWPTTTSAVSQRFP